MPSAAFILTALTSLQLGAEQAQPPRLATVAAVERIPLPGGYRDLTVAVEPLEMTVALRGRGDMARLRAHLGASAGQICPQARHWQGSVVLRCQTRRLDAHLGEEGGKRFLEIYQLRGLPWRGEAHQLKLFYDPARLGLAEGCPGKTPAARGECALERGSRVEAEREFKTALPGPYGSLAALRLGDLALDDGDASAAIAWYQRAGTRDEFGRVAATRLCELSGGCFGSSLDIVFKPDGLPEPLRTEVALRAARLDAYEGRAAQAAKRLRALSDPADPGGACVKVGEFFCRRLLIHLLAHSEREAATEALETYLALPGRERGPLRLEMLLRAAEAAAGLGAPVFGGNLLASSVSWVEENALGAHLLRTGELYIAGSDPARARVVLEYAETRLGRRSLRGARWAAIQRQARREGSIPGDLSPQELLATLSTLDVALAYQTLARLRWRIR